MADTQRKRFSDDTQLWGIERSATLPLMTNPVTRLPFGLWQPYRKLLSPQAVVWVSWPKKSAKVPTEITEDVVREVALPLGFVDVKVCAVDEVWSGLKLVIRKELR